jgi:hypothetical protein
VGKPAKGDIVPGTRISAEKVLINMTKKKSKKTKKNMEVSKVNKFSRKYIWIYEKNIIPSVGVKNAPGDNLGKEEITSD